MIQIASVVQRVEVEIVRELFREYADTLGVDLCFQGFEKELADLPGDYAPPTGRLYLVYAEEKPAACAGLRKIEDGICEMKRLYVRPLHRGRVPAVEERDAKVRHLTLDALDLSCQDF